MAETPGFDSRQFRSALGSFATGVTVITTLATDGRDLGITVSSFSSVSLEPPLVLWSLGTQTLNYESYIEAEYFNIHVLGHHQENLSALFASEIVGKFTDLRIERDRRGVALLEGCAARFYCRTAFHYGGGDHTIIVGEVLGFDSENKAPLIFHGGRYARLGD